MHKFMHVCIIMRQRIDIDAKTHDTEITTKGTKTLEYTHAWMNKNKRHRNTHA